MGTLFGPVIGAFIIVLARIWPAPSGIAGCSSWAALYILRSLCPGGLWSLFEKLLRMRPAGEKKN